MPTVLETDDAAVPPRRKTDVDDTCKSLSKEEIEVIKREINDCVCLSVFVFVLSKRLFSGP